MLNVLSQSSPLFFGLFLLMLGNGLQGSLLGVRGQDAGFAGIWISVIMSAYFLGFLFASRMVPGMIRRVGHVRVFAFLGSLVSAVLLLFPAFQEPLVWVLGRLALGFCFCGVYVTAESWLNNSVGNETRGKALSLYMIVQMAGIIAAQALLNVPDVTGYLLFVIPSVLVSLSFAPILLSITPTPAFETTKRMTLRELWEISPLGCAGMFLLGGVFAAQFGMAAVYATERGLSLSEVSGFTASFYVGAVLLQYPLGWLSDRMDRRLLILIAAALAGAASLFGAFYGDHYVLLLVAGVLIGGTCNPLYALLIAYANDFLQPEDMASASAGMLFINGVGAVTGPLVIGWAMAVFGSPGYFLLMAGLMLGLAVYAAYRMTQRATPGDLETTSYAPITPTATPVVLEVAQEYAIELAEEEAAEAEENAQSA